MPFPLRGDCEVPPTRDTVRELSDRRRPSITALLYRSLVAIACAAASGSPGRAQLHTIDAGVSSPTLPSAQIVTEWRDRARGEEILARVRAVWSPTPAFESAISVPWIARRGHFDGPSGVLRSDRSGLGDLRLAGKWRLWRDDDVMQSDRVSLLFDVSLPTGEDDAEVAGVRIPRREQLGMGAFGGSLGLGTTFVRDRHRFAASALATHFADHDGFDPGASLELDVAWWYRLSPIAFTPELDRAEWRVAIELLSSWRANDRGASAIPHDGGTKSDWAIGLQCNASPEWRFAAGVRAPIFDDIDAAFGSTRVAFTLSLSWYF